MFLSLWSTKYDWAFEIERSQNYGASLKDGPAWPRGKMIGGTHSMNCNIYLRGFPYDYDRWEALGNEGWGYSSVRPIFERMENLMAVNQSLNSGQGPLKIDYTYSEDQVRYIVSEAAKESGYPWVTDFNSGDQIGYTNTPATIYKGIRQSSARAYLVPAAKRKNLHVIKHAQVTKLVMKGDKVVGVDFRRGRRGLYTARATKEVILSAGVIGTPHILLHTGIGPRQHLKRVGIPLVQDLPVGRHMEEHVMLLLFLSVSKFDQAQSLDQTLDMTYSYLKSFSGPLSTTGLDFIGFINTKEGPSAERPNIENLHLVMEPNNTSLEGFLRHQRYQEHHLKPLLELNKKSTLLVVAPTLSNPKSVGKIELRNKDPMAPPKIYPNYLDDDEDTRTLGEALKWQYEQQHTKAFQAAGAKFHFLETDCQNFPSQEYFECYARHFTNTLFHPVGTARMGPNGDVAVVDNKLRVHGLRRLRVCDASVMPVIPTTNVNAATMMIGERCADFIKDTYK